MNTTPDRSTLREWLDQELDGALGDAEQKVLAERLAEDPELATEKGRLAALHTAMAESRIPVRGDFKDELMLHALIADARIPVQDGFKSEVMLHAAIADTRIAVREGFKSEVMLQAAIADTRIPVREGFKAQVMAALPARQRQLSAYLLPIAVMILATVGAAWNLAGVSLAETLIGGTGLAFVDALATATLAGAGLLATSWTGVGLALEELFGRSGANLAAFAFITLSINVLFISLLRNRQPVEETVRDS